MMKARDNPFSTDRVHRVRYRLSELERAALELRLRDLALRGAIVGPEGSGKTTLLEDIGAKLRSEGRTTTWVRLTRERPRFASGQLQRLFAARGSRHVVLFDGAEQLGRQAWRRFARRCAGGLLITSHREGLLPTLWRCSTSPQLLLAIVAELLRRREPQELARVREFTDALYQAHRGNVRDALRALYDMYAAGDPLCRRAL